MPTAVPLVVLSLTLSAVLEREPDWEALPVGVTPVLDSFLRRSLAKDPKQRVHDVADVRLAMEGAFDADLESALASGASQTLQPQSLWRRTLPVAAGRRCMTAE